jgi:hypothetical protein
LEAIKLTNPIGRSLRTADATRLVEPINMQLPQNEISDLRTHPTKSHKYVPKITWNPAVPKRTAMK